MKQSSALGLILFLIVVVVYTGLLAFNWVSMKALEEKEGTKWTPLDEGRVRLILQSHAAGEYLYSSSIYASAQNDLLVSASEMLQKGLATNENDLRLRFAVAVCLAEAGKLSAAVNTIDAAPIIQQEDPLFQTLRATIVDPFPPDQVLNDTAVKVFIDNSPARHIWLISIYKRMSAQGLAEKQSKAAFKEALPYLVALGIVFAVWGFVSLVGLICAITLISTRRKQTIPASPPAANITTHEAHEPPQQETTPLSLALGSEGFLLWLGAQLMLIPIIAMATGISRIGGGTALISMVVSFFACLAVLLWLRLRTDPPVNFGWKIAPLGFHLRVGFALFLLSPISIILVYIIQTVLGTEAQEPSLMEIAGAQSIGMRFALLVLGCTLVPIAEEAIFRGLLFRGISTQWGLVVGVVLSSLLFSMGHLDLVAGLPIFVLGVGFAYSYKYTGSLVPAVIAHGLFNFFPLLMLNIMTL